MLSSMWEPGALFERAEPPVIPSQWETRVVVSCLFVWENNPPCLENKGHGGKPLTERERWGWAEMGLLLHLNSVQHIHTCRHVPNKNSWKFPQTLTHTYLCTRAVTLYADDHLQLPAGGGRGETSSVTPTRGLLVNERCCEMHGYLCTFWNGSPEPLSLELFC